MTDSSDLIAISRHRCLYRSLEAEDATAWIVRHPVRKSQSYELDDAPSQDREAPASSSKPPTIPDSSFWGQMPHCHPPLIGVSEFYTSKRPFLGAESMAGVHGARRQRRSVLLRWILVSSLALTLSVQAAVPVGLVE